VRVGDSFEWPFTVDLQIFHDGQLRTQHTHVQPEGRRTRAAVPGKHHGPGGGVCTLFEIRGKTKLRNRFTFLIMHEQRTGGSGIGDFLTLNLDLVLGSEYFWRRFNEGVNCRIDSLFGIGQSR